MKDLMHGFMAIKRHAGQTRLPEGSFAGRPDAARLPGDARNRRRT